MNFFQVLSAIVAINLDALFFGIAFGTKGIKILFKSKVVMFSVSLFTMMLSFLIGKHFGVLISSEFSKYLGPMLMILIGILLIFRTLSEKNRQDSPRTLVNFSLKSLGLTIKIIKEPCVSGIDQSGFIEPIEALFVSLALSFDGLSASFSLGLSNLVNIYEILLIPIVQFIAISTGNTLAHSLKCIKRLLFANYIPGIVLIYLGVYNLLF
ncbi:manganese efflux pump [Caldicellulosiruptor naganoensis]|uniref:Manganese efflux pump n=1 Tax=Caldicellulosiruptor naganoensis TaxID=29324 RepID=A0ABY7BGB1_9FIRM|nr:manganese efflux pump [Caldicellulosiruptor naganoensis]WAM31878.1 manganese efflux pump [Caldicellulosiruptor naganoensis]